MIDLSFIIDRWALPSQPNPPNLTYQQTTVTRQQPAVRHPMPKTPWDRLVAMTTQTTKTTAQTATNTPKQTWPLKRWWTPQNEYKRMPTHRNSHHHTWKPPPPPRNAYCQHQPPNDEQPTQRQQGCDDGDMQWGYNENNVTKQDIDAAAVCSVTDFNLFIF